METATSTNGRDWVTHDPATTNALYAIARANDRYVAVGANGALVASPDAFAWENLSSPTTNALYAIAFGSGLYVAVGGTSNHAAIISSSDGLNWTNQTAATNFFPLHGLTYGGNQFVAVGYTNGSKTATTLTSADGLTWTTRSSSATNHLLAITFANGMYVAVGNRVLATSLDGITWTNPLTISRILDTVTFANGWYVAAGYPPALYTSTNRIDWVFRNALDRVTRNSIYGVAYGNDSFFTVGLFGQVLESALFHPPAPVVTMRLQQSDFPMISFTGPELHGYEIQKSDSVLTGWQSLSSITNLTPTTTIPDLSATNSTARFYRARLLN